MALREYQAFKEPSPYEQERMRAERLRRYAELLEQQAAEPEGEFTYQGIRAMPSPAAALGKMLQAYSAKKAGEKAEEAQRKQTGMEEEASSQIMGRLMGGRTPDTIADLTEVTPAGKIGPASEADLTGVQLESQYTRSPEDAMRVAMTPQGMGAMRRNPMLVAALQRSMETPKGLDIKLAPVNPNEVDMASVAEAQRTGDISKIKPREAPAKPRTVDKTVDLGNVVEVYYTDGTVERRPKGIAPTTSGGKSSETAEGLRKEFTGQTAPYRGVADAFVKIKNAAMNPSAANDLALIFSYMRALDPASTVREGEFANAQNAAGVDVQVRNLYNKIVSGERLSQPQRQDFLQSAYGMVESQMPNVQQVIDRYTGIASRAGLNPEDIVSNPLQTLKIPRLQSNNDSQYNSLKSGDLYFSPDGVMRRKK
jgi:hypothetical protein